MARSAYDQIMGVGDLEVLGDVEVLGDPAAAVATEADRDITRYTDEGWRASDKILFGIGGGVVLAPGATQTYSESVSNPFKTLRVTIPSDQAPGLVITSARIGSIELVDGQGIEAQVFSEVSRNNNVSWPTAQTSQRISFTIRNDAAVARSIYISLYGVRLRK